MHSQHLANIGQCLTLTFLDNTRAANQKRKIKCHLSLKHLRQTLKVCISMSTRTVDRLRHCDWLVKKPQVTKNNNVVQINWLYFITVYSFFWVFDTVEELCQCLIDSREKPHNLMSCSTEHLKRKQANPLFEPVWLEIVLESMFAWVVKYFYPSLGLNHQKQECNTRSFL